MSEDSTTIKCKIKTGMLADAEDLIATYRKATLASEIQFDYQKGKLNCQIDNTDHDLAAIEQLNSGLLGLGAEQVQIAIYFDQVDEFNFYYNIGDTLKSFQSEKEIKRAIKDYENKVDVSNFDFGKKGLEDTTVVRLLVSSKNKREAICNVFQGVAQDKTDSIVDNFSINFKSILDANAAGFIALCDAKFQGTKPWQPIFRQLIEHLRFSFTQGDYVYIGFTVDNIDFSEYDEVSFIEILPLVLEKIDGVKQSWIKLKFKASDLYVRWPGNHEGGPVSECQEKAERTGYDVWEGSYS